MDFHSPNPRKIRRWSGFLSVLGIAGEQSFALLTAALQEGTITATVDSFHLLGKKENVPYKGSTCVENGRNEQLSNKLSCSSYTWDPNKDTAVKKNKADL